MRFKVGDKVRLLPFITTRGCALKWVGKVTTIVRVLSRTYIVKVLNPGRPDLLYFLPKDCVESPYKKGEQLTFGWD